MIENLSECLDIELLVGCAIGGGRGRREPDSLEGDIGLQLANYLLAASIRIEHLAEKCPEGVLPGERPSTTHGPLFLRLEKLPGYEFFKDLADFLEGLLLRKSQLFGKYLLGGAGLAAKGLEVETREHWL